MSSELDRRTFFKYCASGAISLALGRPVFAQIKKICISTYVYKKVGNLEIKADVIRAGDDKIRPVVIYIHGGALMFGSRTNINEGVKELLLDAGYVIVSIDYRLAPEAKLPAIIEDIEDAYSWVHDKGPRLFNADTKKIAVMGGSAGGYLTLTSGFRAKPRPSVLVSFYGYGDLIGDWLIKPSQAARFSRINITKEEAYRQVGGPPVSNVRDRKGNAYLFFQYCRQQGIGPQEISNWDPIKEKEKFYPYMPIKNVNKDYPPTMLIHGTDDTDVPYEQSVMMAEQLKKHGVEHKLITVPGAEHGLQGVDVKLIIDAHESAVAFVNFHMKKLRIETGIEFKQQRNFDNMSLN